MTEHSRAQFLSTSVHHNALFPLPLHVGFHQLCCRYIVTVTLDTLSYLNSTYLGLLLKTSLTSWDNTK